MKTRQEIQSEKRARRHRRVRAKIRGTADRPRLAVFRSNKYIYAQLIDDMNGKTLGQATSKNIDKGTLKEKAFVVGSEIAKQAMDKKLKEVVFDRGGFLYTGAVKEVAEGARKAGLQL